MVDGVPGFDSPATNTAVVDNAVTHIKGVAHGNQNSRIAED